MVWPCYCVTKTICNSAPLCPVPEWKALSEISNKYQWLVPIFAYTSAFLNKPSGYMNRVCSSPRLRRSKHHFATMQNDLICTSLLALLQTEAQIIVDADCPFKQVQCLCTNSRTGRRTSLLQFKCDHCSKTEPHNGPWIEVKMVWNVLLSSTLERDQAKNIPEARHPGWTPSFLCTLGELVLLLENFFKFEFNGL